MANVNFGIDLGTTNSLIAKFDGGQIQVFKNPDGFKETLASVVGFRNDRILVGDRARTFAERDPKSVASRFKRKMGTTETMKIKSLNSSKTPVELSSFVLKELKNFVHSGEPVDAAVITIPASFDTVQSNATKEAGILAGFDTVILLQEPIAASLAYANKTNSDDLKNSQWIVYDLGGGTFDVALVRIIEGELTVVDHEGDNYLGGSDFDAILVETVIVPELNKRGKFQNLLEQMKSESGKYNRLWNVLLHKAEEAKIELSTKTSAEIDLGMVKDLVDDGGDTIDSILTITRSEFENSARAHVDSTVDMMKRILTRNSLQPSDLKFVLMVGGSTYIPFVRKRVEEVMGIPINTSIDPTNAIVTGAAYFAGTKQVGLKAAISPPQSLGEFKIRMAYNRNSQEQEEVFSARVEGPTSGHYYRITGEDGAFDSGLKALAPRIVEDLPLRPGAYNVFHFRIFDSRNNPVSADEHIHIAQGRYSVAGQMLPEDLSLVKDDVSTQDTRLDRIFARNLVLPSKSKMTVEVGKTIVKGSSEEIFIMIVEGPAENHSSTNKPIGALVISGKQISRDLIRGTEIDLSFEISESRDLTVSAYLNGTGQEFSQVFDPKPRAVPIKMLASEVLLLESKVQEELEGAEAAGRRETIADLEKLNAKVQELLTKSNSLNEDDVTDDRFKFEDAKRKLAQDLLIITAEKRLSAARDEYNSSKTSTADIVHSSGNDRERHLLSEILAREHAFLNSSNIEKIRGEAAELEKIRFQILLRTPDFLVGMFNHLVEKRTAMNDQVLAGQLIDHGRKVIEAQSWEDLRQITGRLWDLMPNENKANSEFRFFTGIV